MADNDEKDKQIADLQRENARLRKEIDELEHELEYLENPVRNKIKRRWDDE